jgi:hypothetical protein
LPAGCGQLFGPAGKIRRGNRKGHPGKVLAKSKIGVEKSQVHVQGGVATIEGKTDVVQHKGVATRLAKSAGAVVNHIQVSEAAREKAAANLETGRRRAQINRGDARSDTRSDSHSEASAKK